MEFIPLVQHREKGAKGKKKKGGQAKKSNKNEVISRPEGKAGKKNVKNQYKEKILEKRTQKSIKKNLKKSIRQKSELKPKNDDDDDDDDDDEEKNSMDVDEDKKINEIQQDDNDDEGVEEDGDEDEDDDDEDDEAEEKTDQEKKEQAKRAKWKQMDEKKKNRLFVKMKKKIVNESQVKELHPDIKQVIFPRKKNSKWCWAVFASEERAHEAFLKLSKNKTVFVAKPNLRSEVEVKREKKMLTVKRKEQAKQKLLKMWT